MEILYFTHSFAPSIGGLQNHVMKISKFNEKLGNNVTIVTKSDTTNSYSEETYSSKIKIIRLPIILNIYQFYFYRGLLNWVKKHGENFDIIHVHAYYSMDFLLLPFIFKTAKVYDKNKFIITTHNTEPVGRKRLWKIFSFMYDKLLGQKMLKNYSKIILINEFDSNKPLFRNLDTTYIPNSLSKNFDFKKVDKKYNRIKIIYWGRVTKYKQPHVLINVIENLYDIHNINAKLDIVGEIDQKFKNTLERMINDSKLNKNIKLFGRLSANRLRNQIDESNIAIFPSLYESQGIVVLEAISQGLATITSNKGGMGNMSRKILNPWIVDPKSKNLINDIINQILKIVENRTTTNNIIINSQNMIKQYYDDMNLNKKLKELYEMSIENNF